MMNILAIDTATSILSIALGTEKDAWYFEADAGLRHSELVMDGIDLLTHKAGIAPAELSGVACMGGPGSFTGLRIGFSIAKGLALALGIPFVPVPTLDCMAHPFSMWPGLVVPVIDAKKNAFFCALYRDGRRLGPPLDAEPVEIAEAISNALAEAAVDTRLGPALLTGPDAEKLRRCLEEIPAGKPPPEFRLAFESRRGYARILLDLYPRYIEKTTEILQNENEGCFTGPEYIRKSDAELQLER